MDEQFGEYQPLRPPLPPRLGPCSQCGGETLHDKDCPNKRRPPCPKGEHVHKDGTRWPTGGSCGGDRAQSGSQGGSDV